MPSAYKALIAQIIIGLPAMIIANWYMLTHYILPTTPLSFIYAGVGLFILYVLLGFIILIPGVIAQRVGDQK